MQDPTYANPSLLQFETNTVCNGQCTFCQYPNMKKRSPAKWSDLIELMYWWVPEVKAVVPFGMQEPFLEKRLTAILSNIKQFNMKAFTTVYTNMTVYDEDVMTKIIKQQNLDALAISFYGTNKRTYNKLQPGFDFVQVQKNIKAFMKLRKRLGWRKPQVNMHLIVTPETLATGEGFRRKWKKVVDEVGLVHFDSWAGTQPYSLEFEKRLWGEPLKDRPPCHRLWTSMNVRCDGTLIPCCLDSDIMVDLGNVFSDRTVYNGSKMSVCLSFSMRVDFIGKQSLTFFSMVVERKMMVRISYGSIYNLYHRPCQVTQIDHLAGFWIFIGIAIGNNGLAIS